MLLLECLGDFYPVVYGDRRLEFLNFPTSQSFQRVGHFAGIFIPPLREIGETIRFGRDGNISPLWDYSQPFLGAVGVC